MRTHIVIVEDDHLQAGPLQEYLEAAVPDAHVDVLSTEHAFRERLPAMREAVPDVVVMDVMLRWDSPSPGQPAPPRDVQDGGYYRAGLRCAELMLADEKLSAVPVVLYTILERTDLERDGRVLPRNSTYVGKSSEIDLLISKVKRVIATGAGRRAEDSLHRS